MKANTFLFGLAIILLSSCREKKEEVVTDGPKKDNCICTMEYDPVCGDNGKTYSNPCLAECDGVKKYTRGECK